MAVVAEQVVRERMHPAAWGCILYILVAVGRLPELLPALAPFHVGKIAVALALIGILIGPPATGRGVWSTPIGRLLLVLSALAALSVLFSIWRSHSLDYLLTNFLSTVIVFFVIVRTAITRRMILLYLGALLGAAGLLSLMAILADGGGRVAVSTSYDPNDLALVLVTLLPLAVAAFFALRGWARTAVLVLAAAMLLVILLTGSRGGFLGLLTITGYLLFARFPTARGGLTRRFSPAKMLVIVAGAVLLTIAVPPTTWDRMATMTTVGDDYNITEDKGRVAIWKRGLDAIGKRPFGYGLAAYGAVDGRQGGVYQTAHNSWIQIGVELGVPGALVLAALYIVALRNLRDLRLHGLPRLRPAGRRITAPQLHAMAAVGLRGSLIGFLVTSFFLSAAYSTLLFVLFAIITACHVHARTAAAEAGSTTTPASGGNRSRPPLADNHLTAPESPPAEPRPLPAETASPRLRPRTPDVRRYWHS